MKKKFGIGTLIICAAAAAGYVGFTKLNLNNQEEVERLERIVESLKEESVPIKFKVEYTDKLNVSKNQQTEVSIKFFDQDEKQVSRMSYILEGTEVFFDFKVLHIASKDTYFFFPYSLYTDKMEPANGILICNDYTSNGMPLIYRSKALNSPEDEEFFSELLKYITDETELKEEDLAYGYSVHDMSDFNIKFKPNTTYKIICHNKKGGIEFLED